MNKPNYIILFALVLFVHTITNKSFAIDKVKTVVVFFALDVNLPAYRYFQNGLKRQFSEMPETSYNLIFEYIDINRFSEEREIKSIIERYKEKYKAIDIDLLITFGPQTYMRLKKYNFAAISISPTVNIDIESNIISKSGEPLFEDENSIHISIKPNYPKTLQTAIELFPDNKKVYVISGSSPTDQYFAQLFLLAAESFKTTHEVICCTGKTLDATLAEVNKIPANSIVFVTSYIEDINKIPYSTSLVNRVVSARSKAPLFTLSDDFVEEGAIGGFVYSFSDVGRRTGEIAAEVFRGKSIKDFTVDGERFNQHMYDWNQLERWDVQNSRVIPKDSIIFNKKEYFIVEHKWYFFGGLLFFVGQAGLILFLIKLNKRQKAVSRQRSENEQLYRELVREDRLSRMSELTASLSHELNQPLTAILYNAQAGKRFLDSGKLDNKQAAEILDNIIEDDKRAGSLISSVRSLMKLEDRAKEKVNLNNLILETEKLFHSESIANHIDISLELQDESVFVFGDKIQLQQVLLNLLFNAANSMESNSLENKKIEIIQHLFNGDVTVSIRDSGAGFDEALKEKLFKSFVTSRAKGMGIGLAVSKSIIESHKGKIWAENLPLGGAGFSFKLHQNGNRK